MIPLFAVLDLKINWGFLSIFFPIKLVICFKFLVHKLLFCVLWLFFLIELWTLTCLLQTQKQCFMTWTVMAALVTLETASWQLGKETYCQGEWAIPLTVSTPCKTPTSPLDPYKLLPLPILLHLSPQRCSSWNLSFDMPVGTFYMKISRPKRSFITGWI